MGLSDGHTMQAINHPQDIRNRKKQRSKMQMIRKKLYPKTTRLGNDKVEVKITERLDGSNLTFFKHPETGKLGIGQRNIIYYIDEIDTDEVKQIMYKGLGSWLSEYGDHLQEELHKGSAIVGEWLGMGQIRYDLNEWKRFYIFAKAKVNKDEDMYNIHYNDELFKYPFKSQEIPEYMDVVPLVAKLDAFPSIEMLNKIYDEYTNANERKVEGFCVNDGSIVRKYVRLKRGQMQEHRP